jgi:hypothetical protein
MYTEDPTGTVLVDYSIAYNGSTCDAAGIEKVKVVLKGETDRFDAEVDCQDYRIAVEDVDEGTYELSLFGLNHDNIAVADSLLDGPVEVVVNAGAQAAPPPQVLTEAPVQLHLRWGFGWGSCASRHIHAFVVEVYDKPNGKPYFSTSLPCDTLGTPPDEFRVMPDRRRRLVSPRIDRISIYPVSKRRRSLGDAFLVDIDAVEVPGPGEAIPLSVRCTATKCSLPTSCF